MSAPNGCYKLTLTKGSHFNTLIFSMLMSLGRRETRLGLLLVSSLLPLLSLLFFDSQGHYLSILSPLNFTLTPPPLQRSTSRPPSSLPLLQSCPSYRHMSPSTTSTLSITPPLNLSLPFIPSTLPLFQSFQPFLVTT